MPFIFTKIIRAPRGEEKQPMMHDACVNMDHVIAVLHNGGKAVLVTVMGELVTTSEYAELAALVDELNNAELEDDDEGDESPDLKVEVQ